MTDANGCLITSEALPAVMDVGHSVKDSTLLENGFAFKPGLYALMELGAQAADANTGTPDDL